MPFAFRSAASFAMRSYPSAIPSHNPLGLLIVHLSSNGSRFLAAFLAAATGAELQWVETSCFHLRAPVSSR
jgi:hypothetical protein